MTIYCTIIVGSHMYRLGHAITPLLFRGPPFSRAHEYPLPPPPAPAFSLFLSNKQACMHSHTLPWLFAHAQGGGARHRPPWLSFPTPFSAIPRPRLGQELASVPPSLPPPNTLTIEVALLGQNISGWRRLLASRHLPNTVLS